MRAVTAIPGYACFGVFMGTFYGLVRSHAYLEEDGKTLLLQILSVFVPVLFHGTYDYVASVDIGYGEWAFFAMILVLFAISFLLVDRMSKNDRYFRTSRSNNIYIR